MSSARLTPREARPLARAGFVAWRSRAVPTDSIGLVGSCPTCRRVIWAGAPCPTCDRVPVRVRDASGERVVMVPARPPAKK